MSLSAFERETVVNSSDGDEVVRIWTAQRTFITKMRKEPAFTEVRCGTNEGTEWAEFTIPATKWSPVGVRRSRTMTPEAKAEATARLQGLRGQLEFPY